MCIPGGGDSSKTDRKAELTGFGDLQSVFQTLSKYGSDVMGQGKNLLEKGGKITDAGLADTDKALKYFSDIMSGSPTAVLSASAPEINAIAGQTDAAKKSVVNAGDRSGGTNAKLQDLSTGTAGATGEILSKARRDAAGNVASIGEAKTGTGLREQGLGLGAEGTAIGAEEGAGSAGANLASIASGSRGQSKKIHDDAVQQWADAISTILFGA